MKTILYIHGMGGGGDSRIPRLLRERFAGTDLRCIVRTYDFDPEIGHAQIASWVAELQPGAPSEVYRDLLAGGLFGKDTAGGYFALEPETETVVYNYFFDLETAAKDVEDFVATVEKILQLCDVWAERIKEKSSGAADVFRADDHHPSFFRINP